MGLELFAAEGHRLPELTTVKVPDGVDSAAVRKELLERYDIEIGGGRRRVRGHGLADRPHGRRTRPPTRRCSSWPRSRRSSPADPPLPGPSRPPAVVVAPRRVARVSPTTTPAVITSAPPAAQRAGGPVDDDRPDR